MARPSKKGKRTSKGKQVASRPTPKAELAIKFYLDPLLPTFGDKSAAAAAAGVTRQIFDGQAAKAEIERVLEERRKAGLKVADYLGDFAFDAARELVNQLSAGRELEVIDIRDFLSADLLSQAEQDPETGEWFFKNDESVPAALRGRKVEALISQVKEINQHNRNVILSMKERREAARLILAYKIGTPEQRVRHTVEDNRSGPLNLEDLSKDELEELGKAIEAVKRDRGQRGEIEATVDGLPVKAELVE